MKYLLQFVNWNENNDYKVGQANGQNVVYMKSYRSISVLINSYILYN